MDENVPWGEDRHLVQWKESEAAKKLVLPH